MEASEHDGELFWAWDDGPLETAPLGSDHPEEMPGRCLAVVNHTSQDYKPDAPVLFLDSVQIRCSGIDSRLFAIGVIEFGDLRTVDVGTPGLGDSATMGYYDSCYPDCDHRDAACGVSELPDQFHITVERATGEAASYPRLVTDDFERVLRIDVNFGESVRGESVTQSGPCSTSIRIAGFVTLRVRAEHYWAEPNRMCRGC